MRRMGAGRVRRGFDLRVHRVHEFTGNHHTMRTEDRFEGPILGYLALAMALAMMLAA
jgi:hypothetical protein